MKRHWLGHYLGEIAGLFGAGLLFINAFKQDNNWAMIISVFLFGWIMIALFWHYQAVEK